MSKKWQEELKIKIIRLQQSKKNILELSDKLRYEDQISQFDRNTFDECLRIIDREIDLLNFELELDLMLSSDLPIDELIHRYTKDDSDDV